MEKVASIAYQDTKFQASRFLYLSNTTCVTFERGQEEATGGCIVLSGCVCEKLNESIWEVIKIK